MLQYSDRSQRPRRRSHSKRDKSRDRSRDKDEHPVKARVKEHFGASDANYIASVLGMVAGGFLGGEAVKGERSPLGVIGGAVLGGLSANAIEKKREQHKERKETDEKEEGYRRRKRDERSR